MKNDSIAQAEPEVTDDQLNFVVSKLCQITRESALDYAIRVGSLVMHYFYGGDMKLWQRRGPKTQSFRRLACHPQLPMSASALCRAVAIFEVCERLNVAGRWSRITVSHLRVVLRLDEQEQCRLMAVANNERWSVQQLEQEARKITSSPAARRGRPMAPERVRVARSIEKLLHTSCNLLRELPEMERNLGDEYVSVERTIQQSIRSLEEARDVLLGRQQRARAAGDRDRGDAEMPPAGRAAFAEQGLAS